jgi:uncharacterized protein
MSREIINAALAVVLPRLRLDPQNTFHGIAHWSRVWNRGRKLAQDLDVNPAILAWFAYLHDSQRENEDEDPGQGARAADFTLRLRAQGLIRQLGQTEFEMLCHAIRFHTDGGTETEPAILACWDADRLDLGRVGIVPDPERLYTAPGKAWAERMQADANAPDNAWMRWAASPDADQLPEPPRRRRGG